MRMKASAKARRREGSREGGKSKLPSPLYSGERAGVRASSSIADFGLRNADRRTPHPRPLPEYRGEGTKASGAFVLGCFFRVVAPSRSPSDARARELSGTCVL